MYMNHDQFLQTDINYGNRYIFKKYIIYEKIRIGCRLFNAKAILREEQ